MAEFPLPLLDISVDHAQERTSAPLCTALAQGSYPGVQGKRSPGWSTLGASNVWVDPVTYTLMLEPNWRNAAWDTSASGIYSKLGLSDFGSPSGWTVNDKNGNGSSRFLTADSNASISTVATWAANRGFIVEWFAYSAGQARTVQIEFGWSNTGDLTTGVGFAVYSDGQVDVYSGGSIVGTYALGSKSAPNTKPNARQFLAVMPHRRREILAIASNGEGFVHLFDSISEDSTTPVVLPSAKFWVRSPVAKPDFQVSPIRYQSSGQAYSVRVSFARPPLLAQAASLQTGIFGWNWNPGTPLTTHTTVSVVLPNLAGYTPDGVINTVRIGVALSGGGDYTPQVYGAQAYYLGLGDLTDDSEAVNITGFTQSFEASFAESPSSVFYGFTLARPDDSGVLNVRTSQYKPFKVDLFQASTATVVNLCDTFLMLDSNALGTYANADRLSFNARDWWGRLEDYRFRDALPLDSFTLFDALDLLASIDGVPPGGVTISAAATAFLIPSAGAPTSGEWNALIEAGDTAADWIERLMSDYAPDWLYGFRPTASGEQFFALSPADLPTTPAITLYSTVAAARSAMLAAGVSAAVVEKQVGARVYSNVVEQIIPPEATEVIVTGFNPRLGQPDYQAVKRDAAAEDPTTPATFRPANWVGQPKPYAWADSLITSQATANDVCEKLYDKLTKSRTMIEFTTQFLTRSNCVPIWRGDIVSLDGTRNVRIYGMQMSFSNTYGAGEWRTATARYTGEVIGEGEIPARGASMVPGIQGTIAAQIVGSRDRAKAFGDMKLLLGRSPLQSTQLP